MPYDCWRGMVGMIKPTKGSGALVELDVSERHEQFHFAELAEARGARSLPCLFSAAR
jgi:hypothetical protein